MKEHKKDMNITIIDKYKKNKKLKNISMTKHKTDMNITEFEKCKKTEQYFYSGTQNRIHIHFGEPNNKHTKIQQRNNKPQNSTRKKVNKNIQSTTDKYIFFIPGTKKSEEWKLYNK